MPLAWAEAGGQTWRRRAGGWLEGHGVLAEGGTRGRKDFRDRAGARPTGLGVAKSRTHDGEVERVDAAVAIQVGAAGATAAEGGLDDGRSRAADDAVVVDVGVAGVPIAVAVTVALVRVLT